MKNRSTELERREWIKAQGFRVSGDSGKEHGNNYSILGVLKGLHGLRA